MCIKLRFKLDLHAFIYSNLNIKLCWFNFDLNFIFCLNCIDIKKEFFY